MKLRKAAVALASAGVMAVGLAACGDSSSEPATLSLTVTDTAAEGLPATLEAGIYEVSVTNNGSAPADVEFIESAGRSAEELLADLGAVIAEGAPFPEYLNEVTSAGSVAAGATASTTMTLRPAVYSLMNTAAEVPVVYGTVEVTGDEPDTGDLPGDATITARDYEFEVEGIEAGTQTVTFINDGPLQVHHAVILAFPAGTDEAATLEAARTLLTLPEDAPPPEGTLLPDETIEINSGVYSADNGGTFEATFEAGRSYAVLCFISDRQGGAPHAIAHDMIGAFTVEG